MRLYAPPTKSCGQMGRINNGEPQNGKVTLN